MVSKIPNDIFQFSTVGALMSGLASTGPSPSQLTGYGSHGIGTFTDMDGELLFLDGIAYQFTSDGKVRLAPGHLSLPFVQVTKFIPEYSLNTQARIRKEDLLDIFAQGGPDAGGKNNFIPFQLRGSFNSVDVRAAGPQKHPGQSLAEVTADAREWSLTNVIGTMFGIMSPEWTQGISVAGAHIHFVSDPNPEDPSAQQVGGHVRNFAIDGGVEVQWAVTGRYHLGFPRGETWNALSMDTVDTAGIQKAEG